MTARPAEQGGVWGSYVAYLRELEVEVEDLRELVAIARGAGFLEGAIDGPDAAQDGAGTR